MPVNCCMCMGEAMRDETKKVTLLFLFLSFGWVSFITCSALYANGNLPSATIPIEIYAPAITYTLGLMTFLTKVIFSAESPAKLKMSASFFLFYISLYVICFLTISLPQNATYAQRLSPFYIANIIFSFALCCFFGRIISEHDQAGFVFLTIYSCFFTLYWVMQSVFVTMKLDGNLSWSWALVLIPSYIADVCISCFGCMLALVITFSNDSPPNFFIVGYNLTFWFVAIPIVIAQILLGCSESSNLNPIIIASPIIVGWICVCVIYILLKILDVIDFFVAMKDSIQERTRNNTRANEEKERRKIQGSMPPTPASDVIHATDISIQVGSVDPLPLLDPNSVISPHDLQQAKTEFRTAINAINAAASTDTWIAALKQMHRLAIKNQLICTYENRKEILEVVGRRINEAKKNGTWTREVAENYSVLLREFTTLRTIVRGMKYELGV